MYCCKVKIVTYNNYLKLISVSSFVCLSVALTSKRVEELYESLSRKNAEIYVQRSRQLYAAAPMRTKLFTWELKKVEIVALADPSIHGKENVVSHMKQIDPDRYIFSCHRYFYRPRRSCGKVMS